MQASSLLKQAAGFEQALRACEAIKDCTALLRTELGQGGFNTFACGELDLDNKERYAFYVIDWPDEWRQFYLENDLMIDDPIVDALRDRRNPFTWTELLQSQNVSRRGKDILKLAGDRGWTEGFVVPIRRSVRARVGLVSLAGKRAPLEDRHREMLTLMCVCFFHHVRTLVPRCGFAVPPAGLTPREIECLQLVGRGQSDRLIAQKLGISQLTAHEYVESAKRKLKAGTRAELVGVCAALGIVDS